MILSFSAFRNFRPPHQGHLLFLSRAFFTGCLASGIYSSFNGGSFRILPGSSSRIYTGHTILDIKFTTFICRLPNIVEKNAQHSLFNYFSSMNGDLPDGPSLIGLVSRLGGICKENGLSCAVAESCTGGLAGAAITAVPGASDWFRGGIIAYSNSVKRDILGVPEKVLADHGAVSAPTVEAMAEGAAHICGADCAIAISGIAGPSGGTAEKPVGVVFIGVYVKGRISVFRHVFPGDREQVRSAAAAVSITHLIDLLR